MSGRRPTRVEEVRKAITDRLVPGRYKVGDRLPSEHEMSQELQVSRATVREAYTSIVANGYLSRRHGSGTFVVRIPTRHSLETTLSYTDMIANAGFSPSVRILRREWTSADAETARLLDLPTGEEVLEIERVRFADEAPVMYSVDRIPAPVLKGAETDTSPDSLYGFLEGVAHRVTNAQAQIRPVLASASVGVHLRVDVGVPLIYFDQVDFDAEGVAVMRSEEWHSGEVFDLWVNRKTSSS